MQSYSLRPLRPCAFALRRFKISVYPQILQMNTDFPFAICEICAICGYLFLWNSLNFNICLTITGLLK